ncbi:MAG: hypothetical protein AAGA55_02720, partial [Planctomycetota bacterium]
MRIPAAALAAGAITALTSSTLIGQDQRGSPPARIVGEVDIDRVTSAPLRVLRGVNLHATPSEVFEVAVSAQTIVEHIDMIDSVRVAGTGDRGTVRTFELADGTPVSERVVANHTPSAGTGGSFAFSLTPDNPFGLSDHLAVLYVRPADGGGSDLQIHHYFGHSDIAAVMPA